jgi:integrase
LNSRSCDNLNMSGKVRRNRDNFYVDLHFKGERIKLYSDKEGYPLDSKPRADRLLAHIRYELDHDLFDPKNYVKRELKGLLWPNYLEAWVERQRARRELGEISREYLRMIESFKRNHLQGMFKNKSIRDLKAGTIEDAFLELPKHLSIKTKYNIQGVVSKIFKDAFGREDIAKMPAMKRIVPPEAQTSYIEEDMQERLLAEVQNLVTRAFFRFCMLHGCRPGEARALKWPDIAERSVKGDRRVYVEIHAKMDQNEYDPYTKTKRIRVLPVHPDCVSELKTLPRSLHCDHIFTLGGKPLRKEYVNMTWRRAAKRAGVPVCCYQGTRHSWISQLLNDGASEVLVREVVGHQNAKTMDRYKHIKAESLASLIDRPQTVRSDKDGKGKLLNFKGK